MLAELGNLALVLATVFAGLMMVLGFLVNAENSQWSTSLRRATQLQVLFTISAFLIIISLIVISEFM